MVDKAKITWKGESDAEDASQETSYGHLKFKKGEAVEVEDPRIIAKLRGNRFFDVVGGPKPLPAAGPTPYQNLPPSQQDSQGAAAKPGEPASSPPQPPLPISPIQAGAPAAGEPPAPAHHPAERHSAERHSKK